MSVPRLIITLIDEGMNATFSLLRATTWFITIFTIFISFLFHQFLINHEWQIAIILIAILGIPHGASDHVIFIQLSRPFLGATGLLKFYLNYIISILIYAFVWWLSPVLAFGFFLTLSIYHFGQSNWAKIEFPDKRAASLSFLCWGAFVLFAPILLHYQEAAAIISIITKTNVPSLSNTWLIIIYTIILSLNIWLLFYWKKQHIITQERLKIELINLLLLNVLFLTTPLLLGFTIYFVCWHSLSSVIDQLAFLKVRLSYYKLQDYLRQTLPMSIIALGGLSTLLWLQIKPDAATLFIFISVITLPHMILIDQLYNEWQESDAFS